MVTRALKRYFVVESRFLFDKSRVDWEETFFCRCQYDLELRIAKDVVLTLKGPMRDCFLSLWSWKFSEKAMGLKWDLHSYDFMKVPRDSMCEALRVSQKASQPRKITPDLELAAFSAMLLHPSRNKIHPTRQPL